MLFPACCGLENAIFSPQFTKPGRSLLVVPSTFKRKSVVRVCASSAQPVTMTIFMDGPKMMNTDMILHSPPLFPFKTPYRARGEHERARPGRQARRRLGRRRGGRGRGEGGGRHRGARLRTPRQHGDRGAAPHEGGEYCHYKLTHQYGADAHRLNRLGCSWLTPCISVWKIFCLAPD